VVVQLVVQDEKRIRYKWSIVFSKTME
jgi:hypothetical protein